MLPIWKRFADGFVFNLNDNTDETASYLKKVRNEFNILDVLEHTTKHGELVIETDRRQALLNAALRYSNKIICLDADEYLDGVVTKEQLSNLLTQNKETLFYLEWLQYTGANKIRVDGPWKNNWKDRIGVYDENPKYPIAQKHSYHLPPGKKQIAIEKDFLFISHTAWIDKKYAAVKQYYWKVDDYTNKHLHNIKTYSAADYDTSVNNFNWEEIKIDYKCKIPENFFEKINYAKYYKLKEIEFLKTKYKIPNLGDWGYGIHDSTLYKESLESYIKQLEKKLKGIIELCNY